MNYKKICEGCITYKNKKICDIKDQQCPCISCLIKVMCIDDYCDDFIKFYRLKGYLHYDKVTGFGMKYGDINNKNTSIKNKTKIKIKKRK